MPPFLAPTTDPQPHPPSQSLLRTRPQYGLTLKPQRTSLLEVLESMNCFQLSCIHLEPPTNVCYLTHVARPPYPCPPRAANISWKGNWRCRSFSITSSHLGSPGARSSSCSGKATITSGSGGADDILQPVSHAPTPWTHLKLARVLLQELLAIGQILPGLGSEGGGDPLPAAQLHLGQKGRQGNSFRDWPASKSPPAILRLPGTPRPHP